MHCCNINKSRRGGDFYLVHLVCVVYYVIYLVWPLSETTPSEVQELAELIHEEAHPIVPIIQVSCS